MFYISLTRVITKGQSVHNLYHFIEESTKGDGASMNKPSTIGKNHVLQVSDALNKLLLGESLTLFSHTVLQTAHYIEGLYPNIKSVMSKFEMERPDTRPDLSLTLTDGQTVHLQLFIIRGSRAIQPKNLGAKSFLEKYFNSAGLQTYFNDYFNQAYEMYLRSILSTKEQYNSYDRIPMLKKKVQEIYPKFEKEISVFRSEFLFKLREYCFTLLKDEYNLGAKGIQVAFQTLMLMDHITIITRYDKGNKCFSVEQWKSEINSEQGIQIYKKGNETVGIRSGEESLTMRFKFESGPTSSVKLATSYETFPTEENTIQQNSRSINNIELLINQHTYLNSKGKNNAIGKCNEALVYYGLLKNHPKINQVKEDDSEYMLEKYSPKLSHKELLDIKAASVITSQKINDYLNRKYEVYEIQEIQLVGDNYVKDRLDTSDLQLLLKVEGQYVIEPFSLKAIAKKNRKIGMKNPGAGQILGPSYFGIGSLVTLIEEAKAEYEKDLLTRPQVLAKVNDELGKSLLNASQEEIRKGVSALLGKSTTVITIYTSNECLLLEHALIEGTIKVLPKTPTLTQTTLCWDQDNEELSLRVKFSKGQSHGWSSLKLSCDYKVDIDV